LLLVKDLQAGPSLSQLGQQSIEVAVGHDIVDHEDTFGRILCRHVLDVNHNPRRAMLPESHGGAIDPAKCTVLLLSPPTAPAGFIGKPCIVGGSSQAVGK